MAKPVRKDGQLPKTRHFDLDLFWREYESIEPKAEEVNDEEDDLSNGK